MGKPAISSTARRLIVGVAIQWGFMSFAAAAEAPAPSRFDALIARATASMMVKPEAALPLIGEAEREARGGRTGSDRAIALATAERLRGEALIRLNRPAEARPVIDAALAAIAPIRRAIKVRGDLLLSRGAIHAIDAEVAPALADYQEAFRIFQAVREPRNQAIALLNIASLYREGHDYADALRYYVQASEVYQGDPALTISTTNNRGNTLIELKRFAEAQTQFAAALQLARKLGSAMLEAQVLRNIARGQLRQDRTADADRTIAAGLAVSGRTDGGNWRAQFLSIAAQAAFQRGDLSRARQLIEQSFAGVDLAATTLPYREAHETAFNIYRRLSDQTRALQHLEALKRLDDQAATLAASTNTALMSARFNSANQEVRIANLKAEDSRRQLAYEQSQKRFQQVLFLGVIAATIVLVGLLSIGLVTIRRSRNRLAVSNKALEKALAAKTEFLATTSHEIRTPLNGILGMTQVMLADSTLSPATRERIDVVHGAGVTMRALVDDLLDVAKMETGNMTVELAPVDLRALLGEVARMWQDQAAAKGLALTLDLGDAPGRIEGDAGRLRQIVFNLLSNAIKFTARGNVTLSARAEDGPAGERLSITVRDTGIGIDPDQHEVIFESFRQADGGTTRQFGGTGLGLTICRNLARAMGGEVRVASAAGTGATFTLDLPLVRLEAVPVEAAGGGAGPVLVVDRNPITRAMLRALLEKRAPGSIAVGSLAEAAAAPQFAAGATVLVDESAMNGVDELVPILERMAGSGVRVAVLVRVLDDEIEQALAVFGAAVIRKPIVGAALSDILLGSTETASVSELVSQAA